jgi:hypothetical protein
MNRLLVLALACGFLGCGGASRLKGGTGGTGGSVASGGASRGGSAGSDAIGGTGAGGAGAGGAAAGATENGGSGTGGKVTGGTVGQGGAASGLIGSGGLGTGGSAGTVATGGIVMGGGGTVGTATGGTGAGGARADAAATDAASVGGARADATATDAASAGGSAAGGTDAGGTRAGGTGAGGMATGGATGTGGALLALDHSRLDFGSIALGTTSVATFTLTNRGGSTSGVPTISLEPLTAEIGTVATKGCEAALPPGASCVLTIQVTPAKLGLFQAFERIAANPGTVEPNSSYLSIYVVGWAIGFQVSPPSSIDLGDVAPGVSVMRSFTVTALIDLSDLKVSTGGTDLSIDASASTCTATLAKGASCVVTVEFLAATVGWKRASVGMRAGGDTGQLVAIEMTANVSKANDLAIDPKAPPTYACTFGQTSSPVVLTVVNLGSTTSGTIASVIVGESARDFKIAATDCTTLAPQATCTVSVVCSPPMSASAATRHAILSVTDGNAHLAVPLTAEVTF